MAELHLPLLNSGQEFFIKNIQPQDLPSVLHIEQRSHATPWQVSHFESSLKSHQCYGLYQKDTLCAYGIVSTVVDEAELLLFVVDRAWQGRGLGKAFLERLMTAVSGSCTQMFLEVRQSNASAIGLYESAGFNEVGVRPDYYSLKNNQREDALIFAVEFLPV